MVTEEHLRSDKVYHDNTRRRFKLYTLGDANATGKRQGVRWCKTAEYILILHGVVISVGEVWQVFLPGQGLLFFCLTLAPGISSEGRCRETLLIAQA